MKFKVEFYNILASFITFWRYQCRKTINSHKTDAFYGFLAAEMNEMSYRDESLSDLVLRNCQFQIDLSLELSSLWV